MADRMVKANGIEIWTEDFGSSTDPTILLIMGAAAQGIVWPDELCQALAAEHRHVIRYDNRDTGQSTLFDFSAEPYTVSDMAADAVGVLDAYSLRAAHVVGASMGGMIAQTIALEHPDRLLTLTSIMSTPLGRSLMAGMAGDGSGGLPGPSQAVRTALAAMAEPPTDDEQRVDRAVVLWRALSGTLDPFDERAVRAREKRILARARNIDAVLNHQLAMASSPDRTDRLGTITVPTLVIHGTADPILPFDHGEATAKAIPGAKLISVAGMGHELPPSSVPDIVDALVDHTSSVSQPG
jgi:pimeloyl-ACP methyl ester carboxylesterase